MVQVHLDTDLGGDIDDLCALALLITSPDVEISGITTVFEDEGRRAGYVRYALDLAGRNAVPVAAGADVRLGSFRYEVGLPQDARYWPDPVQPLPGPLSAALDLLEQSIERGAILVAIGPFTNLALLERRRPGVLGRATLCLMGGSIRAVPPRFPAWDYTMDFNVQADAAAARLVIELAQPTLVPIEMTAQTALRRAYLPALREAGPLGRLIAQQAEACAEDEHTEARFGRTCAGLPDDIINFQHDPLAVAVALGWDGVALEQLPVTLQVQDGWLRMKEQPGGKPAAVVTAVDGERFNELWYRRMVDG